MNTHATHEQYESLLLADRNLSDIWGEGALFAFSGVDGQTSVHDEMVATLLTEPTGLLFHTSTRRIIRLAQPAVDSSRPVAVTGDVLWFSTGQTPLLLAWDAWHTLTGFIPHGTILSAGLEGEPSQSIRAGTDSKIALLTADGVMLVACRDERIAIGFAGDESTAERRIEAAFQRDPYRVVMARLAWFDRFRATVPPDMKRLANKCLSVMKVNTLAPEGTFSEMWSTPDRVPHRNLWLWDSVFHSLAMNHVDANLAWLFLKSVLEMQSFDGMIPIQGSPEGARAANMTQPPLLAWGIWRNYQHTGNRSHLRYALPRLRDYLHWNLQHRDIHGSGLLAWDIEEHELCRSGESGMDNSPRFDEALEVDAVDFSTFQAQDMHYLSLIAAELGENEEAAVWERRAATMCERIHALLWHPELGLYVDRHRDGRLSDVAAVSGFLPLLLPDLPPERLPAMVAALRDPARFGTANPLPSLAVDHPAWSTDMWRGATWLNMNYMVMTGLLRQGREADAAWLRGRSVAMVRKYYEQFGVIFEFFDAKDERTPPDCDRKGPRQPPYDIRVKFDSIRDFHWTAATILDMLVQSVRGSTQ